VARTQHRGSIAVGHKRFALGVARALASPKRPSRLWSNDTQRRGKEGARRATVGCNAGATGARVNVPTPSCIFRSRTTGEALADTYTCIGSRAHSLQRALEHATRRPVHPSGARRRSSPADSQGSRLRSRRSSDNCCAPRRAFRMLDGWPRSFPGTCARHRGRNLRRYPVPTRVERSRSTPPGSGAFE
jgi:hypothetical protein